MDDPKKISYDNLPNDLRRAIGSADIYDKLHFIAQENMLHIDQESRLVDLVQMVLAGIIKSSNFVTSIKKDLRLNSELEEKITKEIDQEIFTPLRQSLKKINQEKEGGNIENIESKEEILEGIVSPHKIQGTPVQPKTQGPTPSQVGGEVVPPSPEDKQTIVPVSAEPESARIHEKKLTDIVRAPKSQSDVYVPEKRPAIPEDLKQRLAADPYKESV